MDPGFKVEEAEFEEGSYGGDKKSGIFEPTSREDFCVPHQNKYKFSEVFDCPVFAEILDVWEMTKGMNSQIFLDGRGKPRYFYKAHIKVRAKFLIAGGKEVD